MPSSGFLCLARILVDETAPDPGSLECGSCQSFAGVQYATGGTITVLVTVGGDTESSDVGYLSPTLQITAANGSFTSKALSASTSSTDVDLAALGFYSGTLFMTLRVANGAGLSSSSPSLSVTVDSSAPRGTVEVRMCGAGVNSSLGRVSTYRRATLAYSQHIRAGTTLAYSTCI